MSQMAAVDNIIPTTKGVERTQIDIIRLIWDGKAYCWESSRGKYGVGQQVPINPPSSMGANITPA